MHNPSIVRKVCFVSSRCGFVTKEGTVNTDWANGRLIAELFKNTQYSFSMAIFADPVMNDNYNYTLTPATVYTLPFPMSYYYGVRNVRKVYNVIKKIERENDILIIQLPIISFLPLLFIKKPVVYHVCANVLTAANNPFKYKGISLIAAKLFAGFMHTIHQHLFKKKTNYVIVNGNELGFVYKQNNPKIVVSSGIHASEIIRPEEAMRREDGTFNLLFIGRPSKEKGIDVLMRAFEKLQVKHRHIQLHMVGVEKQELIAGLAAEPMSEEALTKILFYGFVPWGELFKSIVQKCHVLIMSSISEGTPRVIIEARALGCPVIATNIGGISTSIVHGQDGILISAGNVQQLVTAVDELIDNENLRQNLSHNGLQTTTHYTVESFAQNFISTLEGIK